MDLTTNLPNEHKSYLSKRPLIIVLALILCAAEALSQQPQELQRANEFYRTKNWAEAAKAFDSISREYPGNWQAWFFKAMSLHELGDYAKAVQSFDQAIKIRQQPRAMFMIARSYAKLGKTDPALEWLTKAVDGGFADLPLFERDPDLESLRAEVRFKEIGAKLTARVRPCSVRSDFRYLDFFVGDWDLQIQGQSIQTTNVRLDLAGCVVLQDDSVQNGYQAKATHFYNADLGKWQQTYIDTRGEFALWTGEVKDGVLTYRREAVAANGATTSHRSTFTKMEADRIHQVYEQSTDGGKTWTTTFDAFYVRRKG